MRQNKRFLIKKIEIPDRGLVAFAFNEVIKNTKTKIGPEHILKAKLSNCSVAEQELINDVPDRPFLVKSRKARRLWTALVRINFKKVT